MVFSAASLLLLVSAGYRMGLYVTYYGLSYEKFFASYTVVYSAILFIWLIGQLFKKTRANILKFAVFLFLWMYAVAAILPVEQFILRANVTLASMAESRVRLWELSMLSQDVLFLVKEYEQQGLLKRDSGNSDLEKDDQTKSDDWQPWMEKREREIFDKVWYERNFMNMIYLGKSRK